MTTERDFAEMTTNTGKSVRPEISEPVRAVYHYQVEQTANLIATMPTDKKEPESLHLLAETRLAKG